MKVKGLWTTEDTTIFERDGWISVLQTAEEKADEELLRRIRGHDLFACEAHYHRSCRRDYMRRPENWRTSNQEEKIRQQELEQAHAQAFSVVSQVIIKQIIIEKKVLKLTHLCDLYVKALAHTKFPNSNYRSEKLKEKIENAYEAKVSFCRLDEPGRF